MPHHWRRLCTKWKYKCFKKLKYENNIGGETAGVFRWNIHSTILAAWALKSAVSTTPWRIIPQSTIILRNFAQKHFPSLFRYAHCKILTYYFFCKEYRRPTERFLCAHQTFIRMQGVINTVFSCLSQANNWTRLEVCNWRWRLIRWNFYILTKLWYA